ncbi:putative immunity/bacteriocin fusion bifunctional protein [Lysinibacillus sp. NPDC094177]|uniref:putative immunity/bacteriocin fusion bifunctional protein n=1 Tax=Lysinibacillus sp. NPDC094177 TaxID=3390580 RepID=UPI003CFEF18B
MKKLINIASIVCLILFSFTFISENVNAESNLEKACQGCFENTIDDAILTLEEQGTEIIQKVPKTVQEKAKFIVKNDTSQERSTIISTYIKHGYEKVEEAQTYVEFKNLEDQDIIYDDILNYTIYYFSKQQFEVIRENIWIDMKHEKILSSDLILLDLVNNDAVVLDTFNIDKIDSDKSIDPLQRKGTKFTFNGVSFACGVSGLIACASACAGLHFIPGIGLVVGGTCDLLCGIAFAAGCSIS